MKESLKSIIGAFPNLEVLNTSSTDTMRSRAYSAVDMEYFNDGHESSRIAQQRYESISKIPLGRYTIIGSRPSSSKNFNC